MALQPGASLGPYEILSPAGSGGMGEVYRARDTRLGRTVAIKVLPTDLTGDPVARQRLEREARAVSALSHPRICPLFDIGHQHGTDYLVMEFLEGETLSRRLTRGRLALGQALQYAIQIADALAAAHKAGIIHRDLKPGNIMLTKSGAKILDFGLAKTAVGEQADGETRSLDITGPGTLIGTLPYMAPEQVESRMADARTDTWALGCVLYEMITGTRPFSGQTSAALAVSILERDPPRPSSIVAAAAVLDRLVGKCLAKNADSRWQSAADLRDELRWIAESLDNPAGAGYSAWVLSRDRLIAAGLTAAIAAGALLVARRWTAPETNPPLRRLQLVVPRVADLGDLALSPDGSSLAFIAPTSDGIPAVWVRSLSDSVPRMIPGTERADSFGPPFWSPDGREIAFVSDGKLRRVDQTGGPSTVVADVSGRFIGGAWSRNGTMVVGAYRASPTHGLFRVAASGGVLTPTVALGDYLLQGLPKFLPDDRTFAYMAWTSDSQRRNLCLASLDDATARCLPVPAGPLAGIVERHLVYARNATLFAVPFDSSRARAMGEPLVIAENLASDDLGRVSVSVAGRSTMVYEAAAPQVRQLVWVSRLGARIGTVGEPAEQHGFETSEDGGTISVGRMKDDKPTVWLIDPARGLTTKIETDPQNAPVTEALLSVDGRRLTYLTMHDGRTEVVDQSIHGGDRHVLFAYSGEGVIYLTDRTRDGSGALVGIADRTRRVTAIVRPGSGSPVVIGNDSTMNVNDVRLSPDGRWIAYGGAQVFVSPLPLSGDRWSVSTTGGRRPRWRADWRELYYLTPDGTVMAVPLAESPAFKPGTPRALFQLPKGAEQAFSVTADGNRFLLNVPREGDQAATSTTLQIVLNWAERLPR